MEKQVSHVWDPKDIIPVTGQDFQEILNGYKKIYDAALGSPISLMEQHLAIFSGLQASERTFLNAIEKGIIKEKKDEGIQEAEIVK